MWDASSAGNRALKPCYYFDGRYVCCKPWNFTRRGLSRYKVDFALQTQKSHEVATFRPLCEQDTGLALEFDLVADDRNGSGLGSFRGVGGQDLKLEGSARRTADHF